MASKKIPTAARLREMLRYEPDTGLFYWIKGIQVRRGKGRPAGTFTRGRIVIGLDGFMYHANQLAWLYVVGKWPPREVDHRNTNSADNRFSNLRLATRAQNSQNQGIRKDNKSGFKGISWHKKGKKWQCHLGNRYLGLFATKEDAAEAYRKAALERCGEFVHHSLL